MSADLATAVFAIVFLAIISLPGWLVVRAIRRNRAVRRPETGRALAELAARKGWRYTPRDDEFVLRYEGYPFGRVRPPRPALDLVTGTHRRRSFTCFLYEPPRRRQEDGTTPVEAEYVRVFAVSLPDPVPRVMINRARWSPRWTRRYTVGDDAFDRAFTVGCDDEQAASQLLTASVRHWLLANPPPGPVRFGGPDLVGWRTDKGGFDPASIEPALDYLNDLLDAREGDAKRV